MKSEITIKLPVYLIPSLEFLLERGRVAAEAEGLSPLIFSRTKIVRELIEEQVNHHLAAQ